MKDTYWRKKKKRRLAAKCILWLLCIFCISIPAFASGTTKISDFEGFYLCGVPDPGEYGNPEVFSLHFNEEGNLERNSGMFYATVGSSTRYEYTDVSLEGNTLTCQYDCGYGVYEIRDGGQPGTHIFTLREDGNIESDGEIWYRYETQNAKMSPKKTTVSSELDVYSSYLEENWLDGDVSCQSLDVDNDGEKVLLIHYNDSDGNCEIYKADAASGEVRYIGQLAYVQNALYWSEKYEELVQFSQSAGSETYSFYRFDNGIPEADFNISWTEVNNVDKRITTYSYFSDGEKYELGRYEMDQMGEEDPQAKAEASEKYREYLEDMVLIEFSPVLDFIWAYESGTGQEMESGGSISEYANGGEAGGSAPDNEKSEEVSADVPAENADSDYIIPDSNSRYLDAQEVASLDSEKVRLAINELYARHGRVFTTPEIAAFFEVKSWYQPDASKTDEQIVAEFNDYERANVELLLQY